MKQESGACEECGVGLSNVRRTRCLDCEVNCAFDGEANRAFDALSEQIEVRRRLTKLMTNPGGTK